MSWGLWPGLVYSALDTYLFRGKTPGLFITLQITTIKLASQCKKIMYPKHDNHTTFDLLTSVTLTQPTLQ